MDRNRKTKKAPERWQDSDVKKFDVVICFEERVFDAVVEDLQSRDPDDLTPIHVINIDVKDTPEEAVVGGQDALLICKLVIPFCMSTPFSSLNILLLLHLLVRRIR